LIQLILDEDFYYLSISSIGKNQGISNLKGPLHRLGLGKSGHKAVIIL
jgi:hypothetical protein